MPTSNAAELLIRISADPSNAEASIERFRSGFSREFSSLGADLGRWTAQGTGQFNQVDRAARTLADHFNVSVAAVSNTLNRNRQVAQLWKTELVAHFAEVLNTNEVLQNSLGRNFLLFDTALGVNLANAVIWQRSIGEAFRKAALAAVGSIAQEAIVRAIYSTALGFYRTIAARRWPSNRRRSTARWEGWRPSRGGPSPLPTSARPGAAARGNSLKAGRRIRKPPPPVRQPRKRRNRRCK